MRSIPRWSRPLPAVLAALLALLSFQAAAPVRVVAAPAPADAGPPSARVVVGFRAGAPLVRVHPMRLGDQPGAVSDALQRRADALASRAGVALRAGRGIGVHAQVVTAQGLGGAELAARLASDPAVEYAVVDGRRRALKLPNDPLFAAGAALNQRAQTGGPDVGQWYLRAPTALFRSAANVQAAWDRSTGSPGLVVAVLDTGVWPDHEDLAGRLLPGQDLVSDVAIANDGDARDADAADPGDWISSTDRATSAFRNCDLGDSSWHGTHVAGIVGAATDNAIGMAGIAHGSRILPVRVLGKCGGYDSDIAAGMLWAAGIDQPGLAGSATPARVLNLSLGGDGACTRVYADAVAAVTAKGAVVVAAAGNSVGRAVGSPANCTGVLAVAGLRHAGSKVGFSDLGPEIAIAAPGGNCVNILAGEPCLYPLLTTSNSGRTRPNAGGSIYTDSFNITVGTSFATPIVAGTAALMLSVRPDLSPSELRRALQASARPFPRDGADNGTDPTPVADCRPPDATDQLQCYCTTALCGAGMLDAGAALDWAARLPLARMSLAPEAPVAGSPVQLSAAPTLPGEGRRIVGWTWTLVDGGGIVSALSGSTDSASVGLQATAAGSVIVRLTVVDDAGVASSAERALQVAAAPVVTPPAPVVTPAAPAAPTPAASGGGGALSSAWLALLLLATGALAWPLRPGALRPPGV